MGEGGLHSLKLSGYLGGLFHAKLSSMLCFMLHTRKACTLEAIVPVVTELVFHLPLVLCLYSLWIYLKGGRGEIRE